MEKALLTLIAGAIVVGALFSGRDGASLIGVEGSQHAKQLVPSSASNSSSEGQFTTSRAPDGHFYADARINGQHVRMMIDTGASSVVLSRRDAQRLGIDLDRSRFTERAGTAGGTIAIMPVTLDSMALGSLRRRNIPAFVADSDLAVSLVGQSFLRRVDSVEIAGGQIRLR